MKFSRLYLKAFGPFHDRVIELPNEASKDFHVVFGPNEAGKSTALRAVTSFLFGIPERTSDAFLHDYSALRVGATLVMPDGSRLSAMRRKARKNTLFAIDEGSGAETTDRPLSEGTISGLLGGLDQALYQTLFGLDLNGLVTGSDELLRGEGDLGRSLFQAAAGLASLRNLMTGLDDEAAAAFKPRGSTGRLNRALTEFDEQRRILRDATVRSSAWESAERDHRQVEVKYGQLREALKAKRTDQQRLERIRANLPLLAERAAKQIEIQGLAQVPSLPPEAPQRRAAAQERLRGANESKDAAEASLKFIRVELDGLIVREKALAQASAIEQVFHRVVGYREARDSLPRLARDRSAVLRRIRMLLGEIGSTIEVAQASTLLPSETQAARVQSLSDEYGRLFDRDEQLESQIRGKETALERLNERFALLPASAPVDKLETSLASVANVIDLETRGRKLIRDIADAESKLQREAAALWAGPLSELVVLAVPLTETAAVYEGDFSKLTQEECVLAEKKATLAGDLKDRRRELQVLAATGEVVTQAEVAAARRERDGQWTHMRLACVERPADQPTPTTDHARPEALAEAFEDSIKEADRLADLLHADTQRATSLEATRQRIVDMQDDMKRNNETGGLLADKRKDLQLRWTTLITPLRRPELSPAALREWLSRHLRLAERHGELENLRSDRGVLDGDISRARTVLDRALVECGLAGCATDETASGALARAQQAVSASRKAQAERGSIVDQIGAGNADLRDLRSQRKLVTTRLAEWRLQWAEAAARLSLSTDALPDEARTRLNQFSRLAVALNELQGLDADADSHKAVSALFETEVADLARLVDEVAEGRAADAIAELLYVALNENRATETKRQQIVNDIQREIRTISNANVVAHQAEVHLEDLVRQAGCETPDELPDIESKAARKQTLGQRLLEIDEQIVMQNARPVGEVVSEVDGTALDDVARQIVDAASEVNDLEGQLETAQGTVFSARQHLETINGGAAAAEAQQALSSLAARIGKEARSYVRVRLAGGVLSRVVQLYRDQHQGPLLNRAAEVFARITMGSFSGLTVDYEDDRQVLLGVRPGGAHVPVAGMSQGTRDQLFLSLRLAAINLHIDGRGPFPVIVDDLLVQFDDDRAMATLDVLSELSRRTQVLFFTHHKHLLDLVGNSKLTTAITTQTL